MSVGPIPGLRGWNDVHLKRESEREVSFAHSPLRALVGVAAGAGFAWLGFWVIDLWLFGWVFGGIGALVGSGALVDSAWRHELRLDLVSRRYTRRKGFWPAPRITEGSLDDFEAVLLDREEEMHEAQTYNLWSVRLAFRGEDSLRVFESRDLTASYARAESFAKKVGIPLRDRTQPAERVIAPGTLAVPLVERLVAPAGGIDVPPPGSRIAWDPTPSRRAIELPRDRASAVTLCVFFFVVGLALGAFGGFHVSALLVRAHAGEFPDSARWVIAPIFLLIGLGLIFCGGFLADGREVVREKGDALVFAWVALSSEWLVVRIRKRDIQEVEIRPGFGPISRVIGSRRTPSAQTVVVRSAQRVAHMGGHLSADGRRWLRGALTSMATGG